jgi:cysteinyl-tRNA synthetase
MTTRFYNTLTKKVEEFNPITEGEVKLYTCGPTVYNYVHLGNLRAATFYDLLRRYLKLKGFKLTHVMNLTDVDDKTIRDSQKEGKSLNDFTRFYSEAYFKDLSALQIEMPEIVPRATDEIEEMVAMIKTLMEKDLAYKTEKGDIYFKVDAFKGYGELAGIDQAKLKAGASGRANLSDEYDKENLADFALWKAYDQADGDVYWETEIGKGRPGWHIECSAMSIKYLGETFDIHAGGNDLIFPHHTNEIAQAEGATGKKFVNYWMHNAHLIVDGRKMSKSLGNFYRLHEVLEKGYSPAAIRFEFIKTHYRSVLDFRLESLKASEQIVQKFNDFIIRMNSVDEEGPLAPEVSSSAEQARFAFENALDDDLNISQALTAVYDFMAGINKRAQITAKDATAVLGAMRFFDTILSVMRFEKEQLSSEAMSLIREREEARSAKNFKRSDEIRDKLRAMDILIEDTPKGTIWKKI